MPRLDFKGKEHVYAHHMTVAHRPLVPHSDRSVGGGDIDDNLIIHGDNLDNGDTKGRFRIVFREESFVEAMA